MRARLLGFALMGVAVGGIVCTLTGAISQVALFLALLAVPSAMVGLPLLVFGARLFPAQRSSRGKGR
jgi:hypothetical protein